jgi:catechol 2,3-dioxygenase-like lactoylglutathione lyase family enzyme
MSDLALDAVRLGVTDLDAATVTYRALLGVDPIARGAARRFQLARGAVELASGAPGLLAVCFTGTDAVPATANGIPIALAPPPATPWPVSDAPVAAIDHMVLQTPDPDRAIALWRDRVGLRLALDRVFEGRGLRLVFFRSGGITLEYAGAHPALVERDGPDSFHGLSYRVRDLTAHREHLRGAGFDVSEIRRGMRPGTSVATVRSNTAGVPTLLLQVGGEAHGED